MASISKFDSGCYSEELYGVSETEHDEVMQMIAAESEGWQGYEDFSRDLESENFVVRNGKVYPKPQPPSQGRLGGIEL